MSSILICSTPVHGHVTPLLAVTRTLVAADHEVRFLTGQRYRDAVEGAGARFLPLPDAADYDDQSMDAAFPGRVGLTGPAGIRYDLIEIFLRPMRAQAAALRGALTAPTDLIVTESMFTGILSLLVKPRSERPPIVNLGIVPLGLKPMPGLVGRLREGISTFVAEKIIFASVQEFADEQLLSLTGRRMPGFFLNWPSLADAIVQFTAPEVEYQRSDLPEIARPPGVEGILSIVDELSAESVRP